MPRSPSASSQEIFDQKFKYTTKSLMCLPIKHHDGQTVGKDVVLVYGSASVADLRRLVGLLTTAPLR